MNDTLTNIVAMGTQTHFSSIATINLFIELGVLAQDSNPSTSETEAGKPWVPGQLQLHNRTLFKNSVFLYLNFLYIMYPCVTYHVTHLLTLKHCYSTRKVLFYS